MKSWYRSFAERFINVGTPLVLMGALWLYLWAGPWYPVYVSEPHWGHNYAEALAFLAVGLAYFSRRFLSQVLALLSSILIIPAALELLPHPVTAGAGALLVVLMIVDMITERGRADDLWQPANRRLRFWLSGHLMRFAYIFLGHIALIYYFVRLPSGTYETELVTKVYDVMSIVFLIVALAEGAVKALGRIPLPLVGFAWGMLTIVVSLLLLAGQPETWPCLAIALAASVIGGVAWASGRGAVRDRGA